MNVKAQAAGPLLGREPASCPSIHPAFAQHVPQDSSTTLRPRSGSCLSASKEGPGHLPGPGRLTRGRRKRRHRRGQDNVPPGAQFPLALNQGGTHSHTLTLTHTLLNLTITVTVNNGLRPVLLPLETEGPVTHQHVFPSLGPGSPPGPAWPLPQPHKTTAPSPSLQPVATSPRNSSRGLMPPGHVTFSRQLLFRVLSPQSSVPPILAELPLSGPGEVGPVHLGMDWRVLMVPKPSTQSVVGNVAGAHYKPQSSS